MLLIPKILLNNLKRPSILTSGGVSLLQVHGRFSSRLAQLSKARKNPVIMKLESPEFKSIFTPEVLQLASYFEKYGYEIRLAGGAVRDLLMGMQPKDLDFATVATPDEMKAMFNEEKVRMINMRGESHGTITARINDKENFEITTLRIDVVTDGRRALVEFTTDWQQDALRRDLTINSMFLGLDGTVFDYFHGYEDLLKRRVVFVGCAEDRIREDYLRILRYFRFYGRISSAPDNHDEATIEAIKSNINGLKDVSGERIWNEVRLILLGNFHVDLLEKLISVGAAPCIGLPQDIKFDHFHEVCKRAGTVRLHPVCYLAALLSSEQQVMDLHTRVKFSAFERELVLFIVKHREDKLSPKPLLPFQKLMLHTIYKPSDVKQWSVELLRYRGDHELAHEMEAWQMPRFPISGHHFKDRVPTKHFKKIVTALKNYWAEHDFKPDAEELLDQIPQLLEEMGLSVNKPK